MIPQVPYLTRMDKFVYACLGLVFLAFVEALVTSRLSMDSAKKELALKLDRWSRALFPVTYGVVVVLVWVV